METKGIDVARFGTISVKYLYVILPASDVDSSCAHVFPISPFLIVFEKRDERRSSNGQKLDKVVIVIVSLKYGCDRGEEACYTYTYIYTYI